VLLFVIFALFAVKVWILTSENAKIAKAEISNLSPQKPYLSLIPSLDPSKPVSFLALTPLFPLVIV
jgi:hypothetical protein